LQQRLLHIDHPAFHFDGLPKPRERRDYIEDGEMGVVGGSQFVRGSKCQRFEVPRRCRNEYVLEPIHYPAPPLVLGEFVAAMGCSWALGDAAGSRDPILGLPSTCRATEI
jgi:hypothetical protein